MYALVDKGTVIRTGDLPATWTRPDGTTVSGYPSMTAAQQKADGWYPVTENRPMLSTGQVYGDPVFTIGTNAVTAQYPAIPEPADVTARRARIAAVKTLRQQIAGAHTQIQAIVATQDPAAGTLTTAVLSQYVRGLVDATQQLATIVDGLIDRVSDMAEDVYGVDLD